MREYAKNLAENKIFPHFRLSMFYCPLEILKWVVCSGLISNFSFSFIFLFASSYNSKMYFFLANAECARGYQILCPAQCGISLCDTEKKSLCRFLPDFFCSRPVKISSHCQSGDISGTWRPKYVSNCNSFATANAVSSFIQNFF